MRRRLILPTLLVVVMATGVVASLRPSHRASVATVGLSSPSLPTTTPGGPTGGLVAPAPVETVPTDGAPTAIISDEITFEDSSRPAPDRDGADDPGRRRLRTLLRWPATATGPVPLVVFAHGYDTTPESYEPLLDTWAAAGYLVAAPDLPGSASDLPGTPVRDIADQARDLSFVTTELLNRYPAAIDPRRIVVAGHSDGGSAVALIAFNSRFTDRRFVAYAILSGARPDDVEPGGWELGFRDRRALITVGDRDEYDNLSAAQTLYDSTTLPATLVIVRGGDHRDIYLDSTPAAASLRDTIVAFLDAATTPATTTPPLAGTETLEIHQRS